MQNAGEGWTSRRSLLVVIAAVVALASAGARADIVTLTNDKVLEGKVTDDGETVTIEMSRGTIKVPKSKVKSIVQKDTPQDEYNRRAADIIKNEKAGKLELAADADAWFQLSEWAAKNDLTKVRHEALQRTLELNPDHVGAREASGFVWYDHRWMTQAERYQAMGLVHVDGKWLPPEALQDASRAREEQRARDEREEQAHVDTELKAAQAHKLEAEAQLLQSRIQQPPVIDSPPMVAALPQIIFLPSYHSFYPPFGYRPVQPPPPLLPLLPLHPGPVLNPDPNKPPHKPKHDINSTLNDGKSGPGFPVLP